VTEFQPGDVVAVPKCWQLADGWLFISCPICGRVSSIVASTPDSNGTLGRRVICGHNCGFSDLARLVGWRDGEPLGQTW
jgi:hypothetical protein